MEATVPQSKPQSDAEYIAAIEEMQRKIESSFARMDETQQRTREIQARVDQMLDQMEARR